MKRALDLSVRRQPESAPKAARTEPALSTTWDPGSVELLLGPHAQLKPLQKIAVNAALQGTLSVARVQMLVPSLRRLLRSRYAHSQLMLPTLRVHSQAEIHSC